MQSDPMSQTSRNPAEDARWLAHRFDERTDQIRFILVERGEHATVPFLTDEYLAARQSISMSRQAAVEQSAATGPIHFIFHSAFCCSTLLARALDIPGKIMSLSEPVLLNDIVGWRHRNRPGGRQVAGLLDQSLSLLSRPFGTGESIVLKPSNLLNPLAPAMLALRPEASAILLHAPLKVYLNSIARKNMWGRYWVRDLLVKYLKEAGMMDFGLSTEHLLMLTDLQIAALGWLAQQRVFADMAQRFPTRTLPLDSDRLMLEPRAVFAAIADLMHLNLDRSTINHIVDGPAFNRHSKFGGTFDASARAAEREQGLVHYREEIEMVFDWASVTAQGAGIPLQLAATPQLA